MKWLTGLSGQLRKRVAMDTSRPLQPSESALLYLYLYVTCTVRQCIHPSLFLFYKGYSLKLGSKTEICSASLVRVKCSFAMSDSEARTV